MANYIKNKVSELLVRNQITAKSLEKKAGLTPGTVTNILREKTLNPTFNTIHAIANILDCSLYEFDEAKKNSTDLEYLLNINIHCNYDLFIDAIRTVELYLEKYSLKIDFKKILQIVLEIYVYSFKKDKDAVNVDKNFCEWFIENIMRNFKT